MATITSEQTRFFHLNEDILELETLLEEKQITSVRNKAYIEKYISQLQQELKSLTPKIEISKPGESDLDDPNVPAGYTQLPEDDGADETSSQPAASSTVTKPSNKTKAPPASTGRWTPISSYGWDQSDKFVTVYVSGLIGVGSIPKENVQCHFDEEEFDLTVVGLNGEDFRLCVTNLDKKINPKKSKIKIKADRVNVMLKKVPGQYGPDHWTDLKTKKTKEAKERMDKDPTSGIMDLMKDMYDSGDDKMRETIGKAMMESRKNRANPDHRKPGGDWGDM